MEAINAIEEIEKKVISIVENNPNKKMELIKAIKSKSEKDLTDTAFLILKSGNINLAALFALKAALVAK